MTRARGRVHVRTRTRGVDARTVRRRAAVMLAAAHEHRELSVLLCGEAEMTALHEGYAGEPGPTDVLSFSQEGSTLLGDVVLCVPVLRRQARAAGRSLLGELTRMLAHAILHLLGHDHATRAEEGRMEAAMAALVAAASGRSTGKQPRSKSARRARVGPRRAKRRMRPS